MKKLLLIFVLVVLITPQVSFAEETTNTAATPPPMQDQMDMKGKKEELMKDLQEKHQAIQTSKEEFKAMKTNLVPTITAERIAMRETFKAKRDEFKQKLATLKDEKKKTIAERVDAKLSAINQKRTDQMSQTLKRIEDALARIESFVGTRYDPGVVAALSEACKEGQIKPGQVKLRRPAKPVLSPQITPITQTNETLSV